VSNLLNLLGCLLVEPWHLAMPHILGLVRLCSVPIKAAPASSLVLTSVVVLTAYHARASGYPLHDAPAIGTMPATSCLPRFIRPQLLDANAEGIHIFLVLPAAVLEVGEMLLELGVAPGHLLQVGRATLCAPPVPLLAQVDNVLARCAEVVGPLAFRAEVPVVPIAVGQAASIAAPPLKFYTDRVATRAADQVAHLHL
jgi:hypothetical protein